MTLAEFKAWFEGYTEGMEDKAPTLKQWKRIQAKVADIDGTPITYPIYIDRYIRPVYPYWSHPYWGTTGGAWGGSVIPLSTGVGSANGGYATPGSTDFSGTEAMYALGRGDALN